MSERRRRCRERVRLPPTTVRPAQTIRSGATLFLLVAIYCGLTEAIAFTASAATHALAFARERTHHASHAVSELVDEVKKWRR